MISGVTPWRTLLSALGLIGNTKSEWVLMSIKPGVTASPPASTILAASGGRSRPIAAIWPPAIGRDLPPDAAKIVDAGGLGGAPRLYRIQNPFRFCIAVQSHGRGQSGQQ